MKWGRMVQGWTLPAPSWWWACLLLSMIGIGLSGHLLVRGFVLLASPWSSSFDLCAALFAADCDTALTDARFWVLGVPLAGWGLMQFTVLTGYVLLARFLKSTFADEAMLVASMVSLAGLVAGVALTLGAILGRAPICPLCLVVHAINALLLWALHRASGISLRGRALLLHAAGRWLLQRGPEHQPQARWKVVVLGSGALLAVVVYQWVYVEAALRLPRSGSGVDSAESVAGHMASPRLELPVTTDDPHLGALDAPVQLVVFASFLCPSCKRFAGTLTQLRQRFREQLLIVYRHYPLSTECNERLIVDKQHGACKIAWAAEAAHRQGRFWSFHDAVFAAETGNAEAVIDHAVQRTNLDRTRFDADRQAPLTRERVAADIDLGSSLMIPGTPAVFLNGRLVRRADAQTLAILIRHELEVRNAGSRAADRIMSDSGRSSSVKATWRNAVVCGGCPAPPRGERIVHCFVKGESQCGV